MSNLRLVVNNNIRKKERELFFVKRELQSILNLYFKMVSNGKWKDYSVSTGSKEISFDVYQRASDKPVLRILKNLKPSNFNEKFLVKDKNGIKKEINITRIHMEEDAGKSIHDLDPFNTLVDLNRAGVPLLEIVSEPDIRTSDEAHQFITEVRRLLKYLDICDGNMEEGSLRCDANVSVRLKGTEEFGTKVEVKNMNSSRNVKRAIEFEIERQISLIENGFNIDHETRSFNAANSTTVSMRHKEEANDYRYFPEPDLQPVIVTNQYIKKI